uniref:Beta-Casp domain-containing protein n=1 Tax=Mola mola TaxID=94237 RepID=A0A3Q3X1D1_MOLML
NAVFLCNYRGTGQEVGRSCMILDPPVCVPFRGYAVMTFVLSLTSFHLDHCGALPWFLEKTSFKATMFISKYRLWVISPLQLLYTGDFSRQEDRRLMAAEIPSVKPDILIIESTYGTHIHEKREEREARFCNTVHDIELLLILGEKSCVTHWNFNLHDVPIYYASSLAKKCMAVYQTYVHAMNDKIRKAININNPFVFKHISNLKESNPGPSCCEATVLTTARKFKKNNKKL